MGGLVRRGLLGLSLVLLPLALAYVGLVALVVFAHGAWEANVEACYQEYPDASTSIEWSWRDMGFICYADGVRGYENGLGVVPTIALGLAFTLGTALLVRRGLRKHPTSAIARAGRGIRHAAAAIVLLAILYPVALWASHEGEPAPLVLVAAVNMAFAAVVAARWRREPRA